MAKLRVRGQEVEEQAKRRLPPESRSRQRLHPQPRIIEGRSQQLYKEMQDGYTHLAEDNIE